jgi:Protein of unknown function (DUF3040)
MESLQVAGGGAVALSMEEQRILAEMERNLAAEDPRLASRLTAFGQHLPRSARAQRVRTIAGLLALAMIAAVTITMFMLSPYVGGRNPGYGTPRAHSTATVSSAPSATARHPQSAGGSGQVKTTEKGGATSSSKPASGHSSAATASSAKSAGARAGAGAR